MTDEQEKKGIADGNFWGTQLLQVPESTDEADTGQ